MCHNVREWGRIRLATLSWFWSDCDTMWHVYMDLVKPVSYISNHANTQFTHLWHMCHVQLKKVIRKRFTFWESLQVAKYNTIVILMFTGPWVQYLKSTFVITPTLSSLWAPQVMIIMTTCKPPVMTKVASWRLSVFSAMTHKILD